MRKGPTVFASLPGALLVFAQSLGLPRPLLLKTAGLTEAELEDPDEQVDYGSLARVWALLVERFPDQPLGLRYAKLVQPSTLGILGYACTNARDFRQSLSFYRRFTGLVDPRMNLLVEDLGTHTRLTLKHEPEVFAMREPVEMMVGAMMRTAIELNPAVVDMSAVSFEHAQAHDIEAYVDVFGSAPSFEQPFTGAVFETALLDLPLAGAEPRIATYLERQAESMLADVRPTEDDLLGRVRHAVDEGLMRDAFDQHSVAKALGTSVRSLQRGLQTQGTSFSDVLDDVRHQRAVALLARRELTVADVAFMLGYSEPRAFYRGFRRWTGKTPAAWRKR